MHVHKNARTTPHRRALMVSRLLGDSHPPAVEAANFGIGERTLFPVGV